MLQAQMLGKRSVGTGGSQRCRNAAPLRAAVRARASSKAVCLGEALFDMLADQKGKPKAEVDSWTGYPGGAPCNVAAGLGQLNIPVAFISALGKDDMGNQLFSLLASRSVDMSSVEVIDAPTRDVYVVRTLEGDRTFDSFGQETNTYCDCFINPDKLPIDTIKAAEVLVMGTLGLAYPVTGAAMNKAAEAAKEGGTAVLIDVNWRPVFWPQPESALETILPFVHKADIVKMTDEEVEWAFGIQAADAIEHPEKVLEKLPNAKIVLVTAGSGGAAYSVRVLGKGDVSGFVPVYDVDVQDTTGAGDAFTCGFLAFMLAEEAGGTIRYSPKDVEEAVKFGAACGALTTTGSGAIGAQPHMEEILALLEEVEKGQSAASAA